MLITSCGINKQLVTQKNPILSRLDPSTKEVYKTLCQIFDEQHIQQLESNCEHIHNIQELKSFIETTHQIQKEYLILTHLLPENEYNTLKQQVQSSNLDHIEHIIRGDKYKGILDLWNTLSNETKKNYIQLVKDSKQTQLLNQIKAKFSSTSSVNDKKELTKTIDQLIKTKPLTSSNQVSTSPHNVSSTIDTQLSHTDQKENPISLSQEEAQPEYTPDLSNDFIDIYKSKEDDWGDKLSLTQEQKKEFFRLITEFTQKDQKDLKALLNQTDQESIAIFFKAYFKRGNFTQEEKIGLLSTLLYLYKGWPKIALKLCNDPCNLSKTEQFLIFRKTTSQQLSLLLKLDKVIAELD